MQKIFTATFLLQYEDEEEEEEEEEEEKKEKVSNNSRNVKSTLKKICKTNLGKIYDKKD